MNDGVNERKFNELVIIDSNIADVGTILSSLAENQYALLLSDGTGMDELLSFLARSGNTWSAMHFITHGTDASFSLNGETISSANLDLSKWVELGSYLAEGGDILLYGCNITSSDAGKVFINQLADATGADVAASDDITGFGGDWILETTVGINETKSIYPVSYKDALFPLYGEQNYGLATITNKTICNNTASLGGAVFNAGTYVVKGSTYCKNFAITGTLSNYWGKGGAICNSKILAVDSSTFSNNTASDYGGVIYNSGSFVSSNSTFSGNIAKSPYSEHGRGGVVYNLGNFIAKNSTFVGNTSSEHGGVVFNCSNGTFSATNCIFYENIGNYYAGAVFNSAYSTFIATGNTFSKNSGGGCVYNASYGTFTAIGNTFCENKVSVHNDGSFIAEKNIFDGNAGAITQYGVGSFLVLRDSCFLTKTDTIYIKDGSVIFGGNISLAGNLYSANAITIESGTKITLDLSSYDTENTVEIITNLDSILNPSSSATYQVKLNADQVQGKYLLATGATARTISVVSDVETVVQTMSVGDVVSNPNKSTEIFQYTLDSNGNLYFEIATKPEPPTITVNSTPTGWTNQNVSITATFTDQSATGLQYTQYSLDNTVWKDYTGTFTIDKNQKVYFRTEDDLGSKATKEITIGNIDKIKPTISATKSIGTWTNKDVTLTATFTDEGGSQLKDKLYSFDGKDWVNYTGALTLSKHTKVYFKATDNAGNETTSETEVFVDQIKPTISVEGDKVALTKDPVTLTVTFTDEGGSNLRNQMYSFDNRTWISYNEPLTIEENCEIYFKTDDNAGNVSTKMVTIDRIDREGPVITVTGTPEGWTSDSVTLTATFEDELSGVSRSEYKIGDGNWIEYNDKNPIVLDQNGMVYFKSMDKLGNVSELEYEVNTINFPTDVATVVVGDNETKTISRNLTGVKKVSIGSNSALTAYYLFYEKNVKITVGKESSLNVFSIIGQSNSISIALKDYSLFVVRGYSYDLINILAEDNVRLDTEHQLSSSKLAFGNDACITIGGDVHGYTNFSLGNNADVTIEGNIQGYKSVKLGRNSKFSAKKLYYQQEIVLGEECSVDVQECHFNNLLAIGDGSTASIGYIGGHGTFTLGKSINKKKSDIELSRQTTLYASSVSITSGQIIIGSGAMVKVTGDIHMGDYSESTKCTLKLCKYSNLATKNIGFSSKSKNSFEIGSACTLSFNSISNANVLTIKDGIKEEKDIITPTVVKGKSFSLSSNDATCKLTIGNHTNVDLIGDVSLFSYGNSTFKIGSYSDFSAGNVKVKFDSKNTFNLGTASTATVNNILNMNKLTLSNGVYDKKTGIAAYTELIAATITGSTFADTLTFGNYNDVDLTGDIDLSAGGSDTVKIGNYSEFNAHDVKFSGDAKSKNTFSIGTASAATVGNILNVNKVTLSNGVAANAKKGTPQLLTHLIATSITGSTFGDTLTFGNDSKAKTSDDITLGDGNDSLKIGNNAVFGGNNIDFGDGNDSLKIGNNAVFGGNNIDFGDGNDSLKIGNNAVFGSENIDFGNGKDTLSIGKNTTVSIANMNFGNSDTKSQGTMSIGSLSAVIICEITNVNKITVSNGTAANPKKELKAAYTELTMGNITGTNNNDTMTFGNYAKVITGSIDFGDGKKDKLFVGNNSVLEIRGALKKLNVSTIGKNTTIAASDLAIDVLHVACGVKGIGKNVKFISLGNDTAASAFKGVEAENADNDFDSATAIKNVTGWLSDADATYCDDVDCYTLGELSIGDLKGKTVTGERIEVSVFGKSGGEFKEIGDAVTQSGDTWTFNDIAATYADYRIKVALADDGAEKAISYKINLA